MCVCLSLDFVMFACVMCGFFNVWLCISLCFVISGCGYI